MRILILAPWSFRVPRNGGQLRAGAIAQAYRAAGHEVQSAGLYAPGDSWPGEVWPTDIPVSAGARELHGLLPTGKLRSEMSWWHAVATAPDSFDAFVAAVRSAKPELLQFEEMALWPVVKRLKQEGHLDGVIIVHSSYNFETVAWRHRSVIGADVTPETLQDIAEFEHEIAAECDLIVTVSNGDAEEFRKLGAKAVCVALNGVDVAEQATVPSIDAYLPPSAPYAIFVSSAHPPNAHGIVDLAAQVSHHPLRGGDIVVCGKVGSLMRAAPQFGKACRVLGRCRFLGWVDDAALRALYTGARVVILPKMYSGGSNLKTAEALVSGRPIVATRLAFEGFEPWVDLPDIAIADDPDEFWKLVDRYLSADTIKVSRPLDAIDGLKWENCLKPMVRAAEAMA